MTFWEKLFIEEGRNLDIYVMALRAVIVFVLTMVLIRMAKKRFLGRNTAFDIVLSIIIGSVLARTINGSAPLLPTLSAAVVIIFLHYFVTYIIARFPSIEPFIEGNPKKLMKNGNLDTEALLEHHLTAGDVLEAARIRYQVENLEHISQSYLENNGLISVIKKEV